MSADAAVAVDVGAARIGVAVAAAGTTLAFPVQTVSRGPGDIEGIADIVRCYSAATVFVGDPLTLSGQVRAAAFEARQFAADLAAFLPAEVDVRMLDERLTTTQSHRSLAEAGRNTRKARHVVDQQAAVVILQNALDTEQATGRIAGTAVRRQG